MVHGNSVAELVPSIRVESELSISPSIFVANEVKCEKELEVEKIELYLVMATCEEVDERVRVNKVTCRTPLNSVGTAHIHVGVNEHSEVGSSDSARVTEVFKFWVFGLFILKR